MKDAYSLHATRESLEEWYDRVRAAYARLFDSLGIEFVVAAADNSVMGGSASEEFVAPVESGQGTVDLRFCPADDCAFGLTDESPRRHLAGEACPDCGSSLRAGEGIEIGHVFELGTRYSDALEFTVDRADGSASPVVMGSYGIGVERLVHTLIAQHGDEDGCRWPGGESDGKSVAPYAASIVPLSYDRSQEQREVADRLYRECGRADTLLFDDPDQTIGERFAESDLLGIPRKIVVGNHFLETGEVEVETRGGETQSLEPDSVPAVVGQ